MQLVHRILTLNRTLRLARQVRQLEAAVDALPAPLRDILATLTQREMANAARAEFPHLYGSAPDKLYDNWGEGAEIGFERARSDNPQVRVRGIALWLAVVYHETRDAETGAQAGLHRQVLHLLRLIKDGAGARPEVSEGRGEAA